MFLFKRFIYPSKLNHYVEVCEQVYYLSYSSIFISNFLKELQKSIFLSFKLKFSFGTAFYVVYGIMYIQQL